VENYGRAGQATDDYMVHALPCWIPKATNTHSELVKLIVLPQQQWLHEGASIYVIRTLLV
jgi:hypothetical protein